MDGVSQGDGMKKMIKADNLWRPMAALLHIDPAELRKMTKLTITLEASGHVSYVAECLGLEREPVGVADGYENLH